MSRCHTDHSVFNIHSGSMYVLLVVCVDAIIVISNDNRGIKTVKCFLSTKFHIRDIGKLSMALFLPTSRLLENMWLNSMSLSLQNLYHGDLEWIILLSTPWMQLRPLL
jgi:hypothetical protein